MFKKWIHDLPASLVVFLVALPLSLGIAIASGANVRAGLVAAIVGGVVVGLFGGAPLQVSGPAAGLTVMVFGLVQKFGLETTTIVTMIAGGLQLLFGGLGTAQMALAISPAVLHAMLAGIGTLIAIAQCQVLLGYTPSGSALTNLGNIPERLMHVNPSTAGLGLLTIAVLVIWNRFLSKKVKFLPGSLVAVAIGTIASFFVSGEIPRVVMNENLLQPIVFPGLNGHPILELCLAAVGLFVVASAESLLCAVATDQLHNGARANLNRELMAQGLGNSISGFLGGLPITGVIVRSSANIAAGAQSHWSAVMHGVWILVFSVFFVSFLSWIPLAVLAGLLIHIGVNLVKLHEYKKLATFRESIVYLITLLGVVLINLLWGIGLGFGLSLILLLRRVAKMDMTIHEEGGGALSVKISGSLSFLTVPKLTTLLRSIPEKREVRIQFNLSQLDYASIESIRAWKKGYTQTGGKVVKDPLEEIYRCIQ